MSMLMVHFTSTLDVLTATPPLCKAPSYRAHVIHRERRVRSKDSCPESNERIVGVVVSTSRAESRGPHRISVGLSRKVGELLGNGAGGRERELRSWCVRAEAVHRVDDLESAEDLRAQLEALQQESEQVRSKASSARLRFMRLTHVVEQLRQRAAMDVRMGKDDSARGLLMEKQKVMKALEAARQRAELLEQLAGKLNVAISMKETLLIAALSSPPLSVRSAGGAVHHVSPTTEETDDVGEDDGSFRVG